jgi:hypothetical protein
MHPLLARIEETPQSTIMEMDNDDDMLSFKNKVDNSSIAQADGPCDGIVDG